MKLLVGLGNPGKIYENTRHNLGFLVVEKIAQEMRLGFSLENEFKAEMAQGQGVKLVKPQTMMNDSGQAVWQIMNYFQIKLADVWVLNDDVDLALGTIRISFGGSSAGHKGVASIIGHLGPDFWRVRLGIGKSDKIPTDKWVLENFSVMEKEKLEQVIDAAAALVIESLSQGIKEKTLKL